MSKDRQVVVKGGGRNLYRVTEYDGTYHAYHVRVGFLGNNDHSIGKTHSFTDALDLIRSHSGKEIEEIK